jgi:hypothetical protein
MAAVRKTTASQRGSEIAKRRIRKLVEAIREKIREERIEG